jgi:hypothetical protein
MKLRNPQSLPSPKRFVQAGEFRNLKAGGFDDLNFELFGSCRGLLQ